jgi:D-beta-D-heptose 7-phosphate kinase/D-beta-D-heptose 1-phosphate adenosyltransferase
LVVGDFMLDQYIWGQVQRISPEAPVPVVRVTQESFRPGGAGNVVSNVRALGGRAAACGLLGKDTAGRRLLQELVAIDTGVEGVISTPSVITTCKTRIIAHSQQVVRLDREEGGTRDRRVRARLYDFVARNISHFHVVVVSDYGKGVISPELLALLAELRQRQTFLYLIDPKKENFPYYQRASLIKPNKEETGLASGVAIDGKNGLAQAGQKLLNLWETEAVLISRGEEGMTLFKRSGEMHHFPTVAKEVFDVTGAGDTVLAVCALALGAGATFEEAAVLANQAAGIVVGKVGTATVSPRELLGVLQAGKQSGNKKGRVA